MITAQDAPAYFLLACAVIFWSVWKLEERKQKMEEKKEETKEENYSCGKVKVLRESAKAILCELDSTNEKGEPLELWFPKSQIAFESEVTCLADEEGELIVSGWIAGEKAKALGREELLP